jgi:hypothetical protein
MLDEKDLLYNETIYHAPQKEAMAMKKNTFDGEFV